MHDYSITLHPFAQKSDCAHSNIVPSQNPHPQPRHGQYPAELVRRIEHGLDARGFYVFGGDELEVLWSGTSGHRHRERILLNFAAAIGAELQQGWTRNVALFLRRGSAG